MSCSLSICEGPSCFLTRYPVQIILTNYKFFLSPLIADDRWQSACWSQREAQNMGDRKGSMVSRRVKAVETILKKGGRISKEISVCDILIFAVSTSCLKIRLNERWRDITGDV